MKKKVLVTVPRIPYPIDSGGRYATYETIKILSKHYDVYLIIINDNPVDQQHEAEMKKFSIEFYSFTFPKYKFYINSLKSFINGDPLQVNYFYFHEVQLKINKLLPTVDFCYIFMNRTAKYFFDTDKPVVFNGIDSMYLNYKKSVTNTKSVIWKIIYKFEIQRLFIFEKKCVEKFSLSMFVNKEEGEFWKKYGNSWGIPFGIENELIEYSKESSDYKNNIIFLGRMDYPPNIDAVEWFCENCLNKINPEIKLLIVGAYPPARVRKLESVFPNIKVTGFIDDPYLILKSSLCVIAPMQTGGGLQTKILMAMAVAGIVLSTSLSMAAIPNANNNVHLLIEDDSEGFIEKINTLHNNPELYNHIRINAREYIKNNFSWITIEDIMIEKINLYTFKNSIKK